MTGTPPGVGTAADILGRMETRVCVRTPWRADIHSQQVSSSVLEGYVLQTGQGWRKTVWKFRGEGVI